MEMQKKGDPMRRQPEQIDLLELCAGMIKGLRRFWWLVLALTVAGAVGYCGYQQLFVKPMYRSSATFTVGTSENISGSYGFYYNSSTADQMSMTFPYILESSFFKGALMEQLGEDSVNGTITAETIPDSNVVTMSVESPDPAEAERILESALEIYPQTARFVLGEIEFQYLNEPEIPQSPCNRPQIGRSLGIGGAAGLMLGLLFLGVYALMRKTARSPEEMKTVTSLRCMAAVPQIQFKARKRNQDQSICVWEKRVNYGYRESLRALAMRLEKEMKKRGGKVLLIASTAAGEGKSTLAVNLAEILADKGSQVLLIDGDLRKQSDAQILKIQPGYSLEDVGREGRSERGLVRKVRHSTLWFLGGSAKVRQPASVLSSRKTVEFLENMRERMDYVIIDTPPCGLFQDAAVLADNADAVLYVVKYDFLPRQKIREGLSVLRGRRAPVIGYVFNGFPESVSECGYGRYGYGKYGYGYRKYGYSHYGTDGEQEQVREND